MKITSAEFVISNSDVNKCPQTGLPEYAFIGRSNVGKSSLINMLTNNKKLAMTSSTPGKTLLINHFLINKQWYLVDLPGYGYANRSKKGVADIQSVIGSYLEQRMEMTCLFVLIDSRHEPQKIDMNFMTWLGENQVPFAIVFTKADKQSKLRTHANVNAYLEQLREHWEELPPYFITSALNGDGREELLAYIDAINTDLKKK
ncbi:MAG: YihA family ribosome biogenesis GTP-binding protein [Bacteroidaceae bacterium]|nr:YihA family ribosome biogenesis GTP-binding protein [Bacteroidaceae bacterium]